MRFVKINFLNGTYFVFPLDELYTLDDRSEDGTILTLTNGSNIKLPISIEYFCYKVFSDEHGHNEYQLVEVDELEPEDPREEAKKAIAG